MGRGFRHSTVPLFPAAGRLLLIALPIVATMSACKEAAPPVPVANIAMVRPVDSVYVGGTRQVTVSLTDAQGNFLSRPVAWSSSIPSVGTIDAEGVVTGVAKGLTRITAAVEGREASMNMNVQEPVASIAVVPSAFDLELGTIRQLLVTLTDQTGTALAGRVITFQTSNSAIATVSTGGAVLPVSEGVATLTVASEGKTANSVVTVVRARVKSVSISPPGPQSVEIAKTLQLTATLRDASGTIVTGRTVTWNSSNSAIATVSASGVVTGKTEGQVQITAECEDGAAGIGVQVVLPAPAMGGSTSPAP